MCLKFSEMERDLGEIDRARAIYSLASQLYDLRGSPHFWTKWEAFEIHHGNQDTSKEMLRIKGSVQTRYNTSVNFTASEALAAYKRGLAGGLKYLLERWLRLRARRLTLTLLIGIWMGHLLVFHGQRGLVTCSVGWCVVGKRSLVFFIFIFTLSHPFPSSSFNIGLNEEN